MDNIFLCLSFRIAQRMRKGANGIIVPEGDGRFCARTMQGRESLGNVARGTYRSGQNEASLACGSQ